METETLPPLLTTEEAARVLNLRPNTLAVWRCTGHHDLPFVRVGRRVRYRLEDLVRYIDSRSVGGDDAASRPHEPATTEPVGRFLALLRAVLSSGRGHVADAGTDGSPDDPGAWGWRRSGPDWTPLGERIGWCSSGELLLQPDAAYAAAQRMAAAQGGALPVSQGTLWRRLGERGIAVGGDGRHVAAKRTIAGQRRRVIAVALPYWLATCRSH